MQIVPSGAQRLLLRTKSDIAASTVLQPGTSAGALFRSADVVRNDAGRFNGLGLGGFHPEVSWHRVTPMDSAAALNAWDAAHELAARTTATSGSSTYAEPDFEQIALPPPSPVVTEHVTRALVDRCAATPYNLDWGDTKGLEFAWHLGDGFSQLTKAHNAIGDAVGAGGRRVRIAHLDTGYDPNHVSLPYRLRTEMAWNFVDNNGNAVAPASAGGFMADPSHGTGTLGILAGNRIAELGNDFLGGAPYADIVPVRIGNTWLHLWHSTLADGIRHAVGWHCDVISISAGGIPSKSWADAVNAAYDAGVCIYCASGDSMGGLPTHLTIYPARFHRVVSVCGATHDLKPYFNDAYFMSNRTEGSWGPDSAMKTAISAFAPNIPWAKQTCSRVFDLDGSGTSAATPQAAAAAALWVQKNIDQLAAIEPWQRVEMTRRALFSTAKQLPAGRERLGWGVLQAYDALQSPFDTKGLQKTPHDDVDFALIKELFPIPASSTRRGPARSVSVDYDRQAMLEVEAAQLAMTDPTIAKIVGDRDVAVDAFDAKTRKALVTALASHPAASQTLRRFFAALKNSRMTGSRAQPAGNSRFSP